MNNFKTILDPIFKDTRITDADKNMFLGLYMTNMYKILLEVLIGMNGQDKNFIKKINDFFQESEEMLDADNKAILKNVMEKQKKVFLSSLVDVIKKNVDDENRIIIEKNFSAIK